MAARTGKSLSTEGSSSGDIADFIQKVKTLGKANPPGQRGRLLFALDATMSRQPTWDLACSLQSEMFAALPKDSRLQVQLLYFRGLAECRASKWVDDASALSKLMTGLSCQGGNTQIGKVLTHARAEHAAAEDQRARLCRRRDGGGGRSPRAEGGRARPSRLPDVRLPRGPRPGRGARLPRVRAGQQGRLCAVRRQCAQGARGAAPRRRRLRRGRQVGASAAADVRAQNCCWGSSADAVRSLRRRRRFSPSGSCSQLLRRTNPRNVARGAALGRRRRCSRSPRRSSFSAAGSRSRCVFGGVAFSILRYGRLGPISFESDTPSVDNASAVRSRYIAMTLDHATGEVTGKVIYGEFQGIDLINLGENETRRLLNAVAGDPDSLSLLETWLDKNRAGWREWFASPPRAGSGCRDRRGRDRLRGAGPQARRVGRGDPRRAPQADDGRPPRPGRFQFPREQDQRGEGPAAQEGEELAAARGTQSSTSPVPGLRDRTPSRSAR